MDQELLNRRRFFVDGEWIEPAVDRPLGVISPATEEVIGEVALASPADIDRAVAAARRAFEGPWSRTTPDERAEILVRAGQLLRKREDELAEVGTEEMGCAISVSRAGQGATADVFDFYADLARTFAFDRWIAPSDYAAGAGLVSSLPVGVVGAITPWNSPVTLAVWKLAPALAAGCTVVLKPPPEAPLSSYILAEILDEAGVPAGVVNVLVGDRDAGEHLVTHRDVDKIAFTGSTAAGKRIMSLCGDQVKRVSLELGGKSAAVVLDDADIATLVPALVNGAMRRSGQVCAAQTRIVVPRARYAEAVEAAVAAATALPFGDPRDPATVVGPVAAERQRERVEGYVSLAVEEGARVATGGSRPAHLPKGWYVAPTILADVQNSMRVAQEEIFGPVLGIIPHDGDDDAARIANDSPYGLAAGVWSADPQRAIAVARQIRAGTVNVNANFAPLPVAPFGGFKESGLGRELGTEGLASFLEVRSMGVPADAVPPAAG